MKRKLLLILLGAVSGTAAVVSGLVSATTNLMGWTLVFAGLGYCFGGCLYLAFERNPTLRREAGDRSLWMLVPGFIYRIKAEEKLLIDEFGNEYRRYARRTMRLLPRIY